MNIYKTISIISFCAGLFCTYKAIRVQLELREIAKRPFFNSWQSTSDHCYHFCMSHGQAYSRVIQESMGTCICGNTEGYRVQEGYTKYINGECQ